MQLAVLSSGANRFPSSRYYDTFPSLASVLSKDPLVLCSRLLPNQLRSTPLRTADDIHGS